LPETPVAALVALADKLDTLAGDFAVGLIPTGSADPYGLRRAAVGVLRLLEKFGWPLSLEDLLQKAIAVQPNVGASIGETQTKLEVFFRQRWTALLEERGYKADEIEAVLLQRIGVLAPYLERLEALHKIRKQKEFDPLAAAFKRTENILRQAAQKGMHLNIDKEASVDESLLKEESETELHKTVQKVKADFETQYTEKQYSKALEVLTALRDPLDRFFEKVMVMAEDEALKTNRLKLLMGIAKLFRRIADFSKLQNS
jgi:glycyl-tRNA synthetase beta chain